VPKVVGVVFRPGGKVYYFDPTDLEIELGDQVIVQTSRGMEIGEVVGAPHEVSDKDIPAPLKTVSRRANNKDLEAQATNERKKEEALVICQEMIDKHGLDMKLIDGDIVFGGGKITFRFFAEQRVDFRALVTDLAKRLKMRIELRQVGERDEARLMGGLGPCGRCLCCTLYQGDQDPVSIRMAKEQRLPLNPLKISGLCGRLMCCLKYEQEQYVEFRKASPSRGTKMETPHGPGEMVGYVVPKESLTVKLEDGTTVDVPASQCMCGGKRCMEGWGEVPVETSPPPGGLPEFPDLVGGGEGLGSGSEVGPNGAESQPKDQGEGAAKPADQVDSKDGGKGEGTSKTAKSRRSRRRRRRPRGKRKDSKSRARPSGSSGSGGAGSRGDGSSKDGS